MTPVDQTEFGEGHGNCFSACIASLLNRPLSDLAEFHRLYTAWGRAMIAGGKLPWETRCAPVEELARVTGHAVAHLHSALEPFVPQGYAIASGPSPRGVDHSCVSLDGRIVHDPHPSRAGLVSIEYYAKLLPVIWPAGHVLMSEADGPHRPPEGGSHAVR